MYSSDREGAVRGGCCPEDGVGDEVVPAQGERHAPAGEDGGVLLRDGGAGRLQQAGTISPPAQWAVTPTCTL